MDEARPLYPQMRRHLLDLFDAYKAATGRSEISIAVKVCNGGKDFFRDLRRYRLGLMVSSFDRCIANFSDAWPADLPWPEGCPRFSRDDLAAANAQDYPAAAE